MEIMILWALFLLQCKHLIIDWIWQPEYEWSNKGTYGHFGGLIHAGKNAIGTSLVLLISLSDFITIKQIFFLGLVDFIIHYHTDFIKMNINRIFELKCDKHPQFWWLTGLDQFIHQITYIGLLLAALWFGLK